MWVQPFRSAQSLAVPDKSNQDQRVAVLLNTNARKVDAKVIRALSHVVHDGDLFLSRSELDARRIARTVVERGYSTVFLGGGDGTFTCFVNEIANQVQQRRKVGAQAMPTFGVLRLGTGNGLASLVHASAPRGQGFLDDVLRVRAGEARDVRTLDLLSIEGKRAPFAGLGLDGQLLNDYLWVKRNLGKGVLHKTMSGAGGYFTSVAFRTLPYYLANSATVGCEVVNGKNDNAYRMAPDGSRTQTFAPGEVIYRGPLMMAAAGTIPYYGFDLKIFPFAAQARGFMNLRLGTVAPLKIVANLQGLWNGDWFPEGLHDFHVNDATVRFDRPMPFHVSGDAEGYRQELRLQVAPEPIDIVDFGRALN